MPGAGDDVDAPVCARITVGVGALATAEDDEDDPDASAGVGGAVGVVGGVPGAVGVVGGVGGVGVGGVYTGAADEADGVTSATRDGYADGRFTGHHVFCRAMGGTTAAMRDRLPMTDGMYWRGYGVMHAGGMTPMPF